MSFIDDFEQEFSRRLETEKVTDNLIHWASEKVLESYRNGLNAAKKGERVIRQGKSRRRGSFGKAE